MWIPFHGSELHTPRKQPVRHRRAALALGLIALLAVAACGATTTAGPGGSTTPAITPAITPAPTGYSVEVFFSRLPDSDGNFAAVFSVKRTAPDLAVAPYAVRQLIAGPTAIEQWAGYFTELTGAIDTSDALTCNGADFTISWNTRGTTPETGTATLRFCRTLHTGGIGADARINAELQATLTVSKPARHGLSSRGTDVPALHPRTKNGL